MSFLNIYKDYQTFRQAEQIKVHVITSTGILSPKQILVMQVKIETDSYLYLQVTFVVHG